MFYLQYINLNTDRKNTLTILFEQPVYIRSIQNTSGCQKDVVVASIKIGCRQKS